MKLICCPARSDSQPRTPVVYISYSDMFLRRWHLTSIQAAALDEVGVVGDQHIANVVGVIEQVDVLPPELQAHDVAVFASKRRKEAQGIAAKAEQVP